MSSGIGAMARRLARAILRRLTPSVADPYDVMREWIREAHPVIFDVGAHVGDTAAEFRRRFPGATVYCFEPNARPAERLAYRWRDDENIRMYPLALSDRTGRAVLNINRFDQTSSLLGADERAPKLLGQKVVERRSQLEVDTDTVDNFCRTHGIPHIHVLKLDVQGSEFAVLGGADDMLKCQAIDLIYMEVLVAPTYVKQHALQEYLALFKSRGYRVLDYYNHDRQNGELLQLELIALSERFARPAARTRRRSA